MAALIPFCSPFPLPRIRPRWKRWSPISKSTAVDREPANGPQISPVPSLAAGLSPLYDDGYGTASVQDYFDAAAEIIRPDGGPPRWFCPVECGRPIENAPLLLFLPGIDGVGMGLILHHKSLGKVFEVRCLHIPVNDRTPFEGLVKFVEHSVEYEHAMSPNKPIYVVGDSFGGCLALAFAARNPAIDLILVLINPGDSIKMAMTSVAGGLPFRQRLDELSKSLTMLLPRLSDLADILPRETLLWKLMLLRSAAAYANSRLHAVKAEVLVLASVKDKLLPSENEAYRLKASLKSCRVRYFKDSGHTLLLEDGINLLSIIKVTRTYRFSRQYDFIRDYLPLTKTEFKKFEGDDSLFDLATSPVVLSTLRNGRKVRGLAGVPDNGPVLLVGYHMLLGLEIRPIFKEFLREKKVVIRGLAHPRVCQNMYETSRNEILNLDFQTLGGALPVSAINMYRLFSRRSFVLLYPGGAREGLHKKGEEYKLFWPDQPEFVRMAARFGVTIIPFGVVGEDDILELVVDSDDLKSTPLSRKISEWLNRDFGRLRADAKDEISNQEFIIPGVLPKIPGRLYCVFGKPIETRGMKTVLQDRKKASELYFQIKSEVEGLISYLKRKREEDPYRGILQRTIYKNSWGSSAAHIPSFEP